MALYEAVVIENPTENELEDGKLETIILYTQLVVAESVESAKIMILTDPNCDYSDCDTARLEVIVRPFGEG